MKELKKYSPLKYDLKKGLDTHLLSSRPGVYCFYSEDGMCLYVGKAKDLRKRLSSYFRSQERLTPKTRIMMKKASFLDCFITATEKEALILEAELINELRPRYNIRLRDDKAYPLLRLGIKNPFPRLSIVRKRKSDGALYFGPFTSSNALRQTLNIISIVFKLRTCTDSSMKGRSRPCLKYQIERCSAPCTGKISKDDYWKEVMRVREFLQGRSSQVIKGLKKEMEEAARNLEFERAALLRDRIAAIQGLLEKQYVFSKTKVDLDCVFILKEGTECVSVVLKVREGVLRGKEIVGVEIDYEDDLEEIYMEFLRLYYRLSNLPPEILLPSDIIKAHSFKPFQEESGKKIKFSLGGKGFRRKILEMASINAKEALSKLLSKKQEWQERAVLLKGVLGLSSLPNWVEGVDISNIQGNLSIGSLVCFKNGRPFKEGYRHYNLGSDGPDDYRMIYEVIKKRLKRKPLPDLMIIDGGKGQLNMALKAANDMSLLNQVDFISIAKEREGEGEKIYIPGREEPLDLSKESQVLRFCQMVRDEAHRFGIKTHRSMRLKKGLATSLSEIDGIGQKRQMLLLRHFGSVSGIKKASLNELLTVPGLPKDVAKRVYEYFRKGD